MDKFRNYSIEKKLTSTFLIIAIIGLIIGAVGIYGMLRLSQEDKEMYEENTLPMSYLSSMYDNLASQRICANNMVIFREADPTFAKEEAQSLQEKEQLFEDALSQYGDSIPDIEVVEQALYENIVADYNNLFADAKADVIAAIAAGDADAMAAGIKEMDDLGAQISGYMDEAFALNVKLASEKVDANQSLFMLLLVVLIVVMIVGFVLSQVISRSISKMISEPVARILAVTQQAGETGNFEFDETTITTIKRDATAKVFLSSEKWSSQYS